MICSDRKSGGELLSTAEVPWSTTKSDGMWAFLGCADATDTDGSRRDAAGARVGGHRTPWGGQARHLTGNFTASATTPRRAGPTATHRDGPHRRAWRPWRTLGALGAWRAWEARRALGPWRAWRPGGAGRPEKLAAHQDIPGVRHPKESTGPRPQQVPSAIVMKFASGPRLRPGESPHPHGVSTVPFDPGLGVAGPYHATALLRVAFDARATLTHPKDAAAGRQGFPKHPIAVRRIVPERQGPLGVSRCTTPQNQRPLLYKVLKIPVLG